MIHISWPRRRALLACAAVTLGPLWAHAAPAVAQPPEPPASNQPALEVGGESARPVAAARNNRHALIISIGRYADPRVIELPGTRIDRQSATQMARAMQVPPGQITYLQDEQATAAALRGALKALAERVQPGDRVFIHYSGHGTRLPDPQTGGCVEALMPFDGNPSELSASVISNHEMADLLAPITRKTDKLFVMYDACHSGGVAMAARTRAVKLGGLRPKFTPASLACSKPSNLKTRALINEVRAQGALPHDVIHLSAARNDEISFDDELKGGLATQYVRDCMLRDARDADASGAISIDEVRVCAQEKIDRRLRGDPNFSAHHLTLNGNAAFVPAWFAQALPAAPAQPAAVVTAVASAAGAATPSPALASLPPVAHSGAQALEQIWAQRDGKRALHVQLDAPSLRIGHDTLGLTLRSARAGFVYVLMAGSDNRTLDVLFPNRLDADARIAPGQTLHLPRSGWQVQAGGPPGRDRLLVMVSDEARDLSALRAAGPFMQSLNDLQGRSQLGALLNHGVGLAGQGCVTATCSDAFAAELLDVHERP